MNLIYINNYLFIRKYITILKMNTTTKNHIEENENLCDYCGNSIEICMCVCPYCGETNSCECCLYDAVTGGG